MRSPERKKLQERLQREREELGNFLSDEKGDGNLLGLLIATGIALVAANRLSKHVEGLKRDMVAEELGMTKGEEGYFAFIGKAELDIKEGVLCVTLLGGNRQLRVPLSNVGVGIDPKLKGTGIVVEDFEWRESSKEGSIRATATNASIIVANPELADKWEESLREARKEFQKFQSPRDVLPKVT